jgi:hypothetical protein
VIGSLDDALPSSADRLDPSAPLAVFFVGGARPPRAHAQALFKRTLGAGFGQLLFVSIGEADAAWADEGVLGAKAFKGDEEARRLLFKTRGDLDDVLAWARAEGFRADCRVTIGVNVAEECGKLAEEIAARFPSALFVVTKLARRKPSWLDRLLREGTADKIRALLERRGLPVAVLPILLPD